MDDKLPVKTYVPQNFVRIWYIGIFNSDDVITVHFPMKHMMPVIRLSCGCLGRHLKHFDIRISHFLFQ